MSPVSVLTLYALARTLADRLVTAAAGRPEVAAACVTWLGHAAAAVEADAARVSADEVRAAARVRAALAEVGGRVDCGPAADAVAELVRRWFGPRGLPAGEVADFDRVAGRLRDHQPGRCALCPPPAATRA